jgi:orotate phosphoribosyltransferase
MSNNLLQILRERSVMRTTPDKPFTLKSGATSLTYVDIRLAALNHEGLCRLSNALVWEMDRSFDRPDRVAGVIVGGCPLATGVSFRSAIDVLYVRAEAKDHGTGKLIEGAFEPGMTVVLFEDVITSGGSTLAAIRALRDAGLDVTRVIAVLDREQGGCERIKQECAVSALFTLKELLS